MPVKFDLTADMFPPSWRSGEIQATAIQIADNQIARSTVISDKAMSKYPPEVLTKNLKAVYFVKEMRFYGLQYGGTNSRENVYITNRGPVMGFSDKFVEATFHHEFSSILLRNYNSLFDEKGWTHSNRPGTHYGSSGMQALKEGNADTTYMDVYNVDGFLNQYAKASIEEDFNTFAEALFSGDREYWRIVSLFPRVQKKHKIAIQFFHSIDPQFTEDYFRSLVQ